MFVMPSGCRPFLPQAFMYLFLFLMPVAAHAAEELPVPSRSTAEEAPLPAGTSSCASIAEEKARLACFDRLAEKEKAYAEMTFMEKQWDLIPREYKGPFVLRPHRTNYILIYAYNESTNQDTALEYDEDAKAQDAESKFQISIKAKALEYRFISLWMAYTQQSFWQLYNNAFSSPFRDTNYEPEALLNLRLRYEIPGLQGLKLQFIQGGFNHQSNGRSEPLSRSWNRLVANIGLEKGNFNALLKTWYRIPEDEEDDDNPHIMRYMGYGELWMTYVYKDNRFAVMLRNNLRHDDRGAVQLDYSLPLSNIFRWASDKFAIYVQYFNGYGESLLDYNDSSNRIGAGFMIVDWL